jgi:hypothetical protein
MILHYKAISAEVYVYSNLSNVTFTYEIFYEDVFKVPSHQIRLCLKWYGWIGLDEYKDRGW